jgi:hypothetical protein
VSRCPDYIFLPVMIRRGSHRTTLVSRLSLFNLKINRRAANIFGLSLVSLDAKDSREYPYTRTTLRQHNTCERQAESLLSFPIYRINCHFVLQRSTFRSVFNFVKIKCSTLIFDRRPYHPPFPPRRSRSHRQSTSSPSLYLSYLFIFEDEESLDVLRNFNYKYIKEIVQRKGMHYSTFELH